MKKTFKLRSAALFYFLASLSLPTHLAYAICKNENETQHATEVALANMVIYSQEYMKYFFADDESRVRPLPASGMSLFLTRDFSARHRWMTALTLPLREEEVAIRGEETFKYYYPKLAMLGVETDLSTGRPFAESSCFRLSAAAGLALPLSNRVTKYTPPFVLIRSGAEVSTRVFLNFGIGYSGNIENGAWFFPFGVSYVMF